MMKKSILFVETSDIGARYSAEAALRLGFTPIFLINPPGYQGDTREQLNSYSCISCNTNSAHEIVKTIAAHNLDNAVAITTFLDSRLVPTIDAGRQLGLRTLDSAIFTLKDKGLVASLIPELSPQTLRFDRSDVPIEQIRTFLCHHPKAVLKPTDAAGGIGNHLITPNNVNGLPELVSAHGWWVLQEFCEGPLVSAEGYVLDGRVVILGFSGRKKVGLTESMVDFPSDVNNMTSQQIADCRQALEQLITRSRFQNGYFHVEFILGQGRSMVIDANVGRLGGGSVGEQIADSFNLDPVEVYQHVLQVSLFPEEPSGSSIYAHTRTATLGILYGLSKSGFFQEIRYPRQMKSRHTQVLDSGQAVAEMGANNWSWLGILSGPKSQVERDIQQIQIRSGGQWQSPCY